MKKLNYLIGLLTLAIVFSCSKDNDLIDVDTIEAPTNVSALFTIKQDNSGSVKIIPRGEGVTQFEIYYGDNSTESVIVNPGSFTEHTYTEGVFPVKIIASTLNGKTTEVIQDLTVSFLQPTDLNVTIAHVVGNNLGITVAATANLETFFQVYFGESPTETPVDFMEGETITHNYTNVGTYNVRVLALTGGAAFAEYNETVEIINPILLPIDFESTTLNYSFTNFGGATTTVVNNPNVNASNTSSKVARLNKMAGSQVWAGSFIELGSPIDFSTLQKIKMKVWAPQNGIVVKMKLENLADPTINTEVDVTNTIANSWNELTFNFTGINNANNYQRIVVFFNFGNAGTGLNYYFDDIQLTSGVEQLVLPVTFESATLPYTFTNFGGATSTVANNPDATGINTSAKVGKLVKSNGSQVWAGSFLELASPINFSSLQKIKVKVWSPQAGITVKLKLEKLSDATVNTELDAVTTTSNAWEELTYDFTGINNANNYQRVVLFFAFGNAGTGASYYFDDIKQSN